MNADEARAAASYRQAVVRSLYERGYTRIIPLRGKVPKLKGWRQYKPTLAQALAHAKAGNIGLACEGLVVLDVDGDRGGYIESDWPVTWRVQTSSGSSHSYYAAPAQVPIRNSTGKLRSGVDVRSDGGYAVLPGSIHPDSDEMYRWLPGHSPDDLTIAELPRHLVERMTTCSRIGDSLQGVPVASKSAPRIIEVANREAFAASVLARELENVRTASKGSRNDTLNRAAFNLGQIINSTGLERNTVESELHQAAIDSGLQHGEAIRTIGSGLEGGETTPREVRDACSPTPPIKEGNGNEHFESGEGMADSQPQSSSPDSFPSSPLFIAGTGNKKTNALKMRPQPLGEFFQSASSPVDYLVENLLLNSGLSLLVAKPKVGKTTWLLCLAAAVALGRRFLGRDVRQGPVLYYSFEEKASKIAEYLQALGATGSTPIHVYCGSAVKDAIQDIHAAVTEIKPSLVIIDTLFRILPCKDANAYVEMMRAMEPLLALARNNGCHVIVAHHAGKGDRQGADSILGSTAICGSVDLTIMLDRSDGERYMRTEQRYGEDMERTLLELDPETREVSLGDSREHFLLHSHEHYILEFLRGQSDPVTEDAISSAVTGKTSAKRSALRSLVESGKVARAGSGKKGDPYHYQIQTVNQPSEAA